MNARALRYARFAAVEDYLRQGWMPLIPNAPMHHHHYGIELAWLCDCPIPCEIEFNRVTHRVPSPTEGIEHERAASGV
jgi:hypothetical protein